MHHRSHDREALDRSSEPDSSLESGSSLSPEDLRVRIHEAANWLAVLRGHLDLARRRRRTDEATWSALQRAAAGVERALAGESTPTDETTDLGALVREVGEDVRRTAAGIDLRVDAPPVGEVVGRFAAPALRDALLNLVRNAADALAARSDGSVAVVARLRDGTIDCVVEDDGPGMPPEVRERCFESGFSTKGPGRGLGLARVSASVRAAGGTLDVASRPGTGTRFRLTLPLHERAVDPAGPSDAPLPSSVLVLDDDPSVGAVLVEMMQALGVDGAWSTTDPADLLPACRAGGLDMVVVDLDLGVARGDRLAIEVRQVDPAVAIVLLTGDPLTATGATRGVIDATVTKPLGLDALRRHLQDAHRLTRRRRRAALRAHREDG